MGNVHAALRLYFQDIIDFQVDFFAGDANQAAFRYYNKQTIPDPANSVVQVYFNQMITPRCETIQVCRCLLSCCLDLLMFPLVFAVNEYYTYVSFF